VIAVNSACIADIASVTASGPSAAASTALVARNRRTISVARSRAAASPIAATCSTSADSADRFIGSTNSQRTISCSR